MALFFVPLTGILLAGLPPSKIPAAAGLSNFARVFCGAVGTSLAGNAWTNRIALHHQQLTEQANVYNPTFNQSLEQSQSLLHIDPAQARALFDFNVNAQAAMLGLNDIFYASAIIFVLIIPLVWITKRPKKAAGGGADAAAGAH